jgi:HEAT repeat protein
MKIAGDHDALLRTSAILTLGDFGQKARRAVPTLLAALSDTEAAIRDSATNALQSIAPEALRNASAR